MTIAMTFVNNAAAWWGNGHMLVARVAYDKIMAVNPALMDKANTILAGISQFTTLESKYPFVECATFADEIKNEGFDDQSHWHFVDNPFYDQGFTANIAPNEYNVTWAIGEMINALKGVKSSALKSGAVNPIFGESFDLRLLIHYIGDIHQPLHAVSRYIPSQPAGDQGGNKFYLTMNQGINELHALWDSVLYQMGNDLSLPLSDDDWEALGMNSTRITADNPESSFTDISKSYTEWNAEALALAESFVYVNIQPNTIPSDDYLAQGVALAEKQIAKAGYRLANQLISMWGKSTEEVIEDQIEDSGLFLN